MIRLRVNGLPAPQGSKRHVGDGIMIEASKAVGPWREAVRAEAQRLAAAPFGAHEPVAVTLVFYLPRPKGHYGTGRNAGQLRPGAPPRPAGKPDIDKLERAVLDGLTQGGVLADDAQVVDVIKSKLYASDKFPPGCYVEAETCHA